MGYYSWSMFTHDIQGPSNPIQGRPSRLHTLLLLLFPLSLLQLGVFTTSACRGWLGAAPSGCFYTPRPIATVKIE